MGVKKRVPLHQNPRGFVEVDPTATEGAILGVNLRDSAGNVIRPQDVLNQQPSGGGTSSIASTIWKLIREIPANIQKLAALIGRGFAIRRDDGEWALRTLQPGDGIDIANGDGEAGDPTISLEDLANTGVGAALVKITRDAKGRISGTQAATTDDLTEGSANLYFTSARASAAAPVQSVNARTGVVAVPDFVRKATTPVAGDFGRPIIDGDRWFNTSTGISYTYNGGAWLSDGSSAPVSSVFGRTGAVLAQTGDYTAAQVGALSSSGGAVAGDVSVTGQVISLGATAGLFVYDRVITGAAYAYYSISNSFSIFSSTLGDNIQTVDPSGNTCPGSNNTRQLGSSTLRWKEVFAVNGAINTSDAREKTPVRALSAEELAAAIALSDELGAFKWLASMQEKGEEARWHVGMTVQRAIQIMQSHGLDPYSYGFICYDEWEARAESCVIVEEGTAPVTFPAVPAGDLFSFRPSELHAFVLAGVAERQRRIEQRLQALEQGA